MNYPIKIERLPESAWKEGRDLRLESLKEEPLAFGSSYEEERSLSEAEWKVRIKNAVYAIDNRIPVGMIVFIRQSHLKNKHAGNIFGFYVRQSHRGNGIGRKLIEYVIRLAKETEGLKKISLTVNVAQKEAIALYEKTGFAVVGKLQSELYYEGNYYDELVMELLP